MILTFSNWKITKPSGTLGYQYDNLTRELVVQGDLPEGWTWDILVSASGNSDTWPLALGDGQASITLTDDNLSVRGEYYLQLRGTNGDQVRHTNVITAYNSRSLSGAGQWPTLPTEWIQAEKDIKELNAHPPVPGSNGYWLLWDLSSHSYQESDLPVPVGPAGPPNVLEIGTVETLPADQPATASITGESPAQKLNLGIPQGKQGATGNPGAPGKDGQNGVTPTLSAGNVETLEPGQPATASVTGEGPAYQINLGIPQGKTGETGAQGVQGEIGPRGYTFTPAVDDAGNLSWTNDGGLPNPEEINIKGPIGATCPQGNPGATPTITVGTVATLDPGQDATAEITGETPNLTLNLGIPEGQPGQDGVQINDEAVNTTEAWSSKKIVDTLCPSFSVSGNPVTCHPVEGYPLRAVVTLKPKQAGSGDPSPENVRPISGYDSLTVNERGKNLFNISKIENTNYITNNGNGSLTVTTDVDSNGVSSGKTLRELCEGIVPGLYTLNAESTGSEKWVYTPAIDVWYYGTSKTLTDEMLDSTLYLYASGTETTATISNIQLELGSTPTPYEPYQPGTTATLTLPETIYGGTVDAVTGVGEKTWHNLVLTGDESWVLSGQNLICYNLVDLKATSTGICSHLPYKKDAFGNGIYLINTGAFASVALGSEVSKNYTVESWSQYLKSQFNSGTPVTIAYQLVTPEPFQATGNQALPAVAGLNTVYTDGDRLAVSGRQDLLYTLQSMQTQTQNLNRFIAEGGTR